MQAIIEQLTNRITELIVNNNFTVIESDAHTLTIKIEGYRLQIWLANSWEFVRIYEGDFIKFSKDQKRAIYLHLIQIFKKNIERQIDDLTNMHTRELHEKLNRLSVYEEEAINEQD